MVQQVVWIHIYDLEPRTLSISSLIARFIYSLFDIIPITLVAVAIKLVQLRIKALKHETMLVAEKVKSELMYLKSQTNPHFLFNTLNSIYALSRKQDENTPKAIISLSKILRYMLYETSHHTNPLKDELVLIEDYISLQKLRFQEHLTIRFSKNIDQEEAGISPLLLLPLVENAFKHSNALNMVVDIQVDLKGSLLDFTISNNLSESVDQDEAFEDGIGLNNIKRQLAILYRAYSFTAKKSETDFKVHLHVDLSTYAHV
jgi:LytS/YehU family sensor histidine kinase